MPVLARKAEGSVPVPPAPPTAACCCFTRSGLPAVSSYVPPLLLCRYAPLTGRARARHDAVCPRLTRVRIVINWALARPARGALHSCTPCIHVFELDLGHPSIHPLAPPPSWALISSNDGPTKLSRSLLPTVATANRGEILLRGPQASLPVPVPSCSCFFLFFFFLFFFWF